MTEIHVISVDVTACKLHTLTSGMSLTATSCWSVLRFANSTCPNPPRPIWRMNWYLSPRLFIAHAYIQCCSTGRTFITVNWCTVLQYEWLTRGMVCSVLIGRAVHTELAIRATVHIPGKLQFEQALCKRMWVKSTRRYYANQCYWNAASNRYANQVKRENAW